MKKFFLAIFLLLAFLYTSIFAGFSVLAAPLEDFTSEKEVNSFELFWPIVAGKVRGDSLYSLKIVKEKLRGSLIFGAARKAEYLSMISRKRLVEFEKLALVNKDFDNAIKTMSDFSDTQSKTVFYIERAKKEGLDIGSVVGIVVDTFDREVLLLKSIAVKVDNSQKSLVEKTIASTDSLLEKLR